MCPGPRKGIDSLGVLLETLGDLMDSLGDLVESLGILVETLGDLVKSLDVLVGTILVGTILVEMCTVVEMLGGWLGGVISLVQSLADNSVVNPQLQICLVGRIALDGAGDKCLDISRRQAIMPLFSQ